jgi:hypothetical protein
MEIRKRLIYKKYPKQNYSIYSLYEFTRMISATFQTLQGFSTIWMSEPVNPLSKYTNKNKKAINRRIAKIRYDYSFERLSFENHEGFVNST